MKLSITILTFLFCTLSVQGQKKAENLYQTAVSYYENGEYYKAATVFEQIVGNYKKFVYYDQCFYNTAYSYHQADSLDLAINWYEKIRNSDLNDGDRVGGRGIFEPFANYKHYSTFNIATIEYNRKNYEKALDYYRQSFIKHPYHNESETAIRQNKNRLTINLVDCLEKLGRYEEALLTIVPKVLDSKGSVNYSSIVNRAIQLLTAHFDKVKIKMELDFALETLEHNVKENSFSIEIRNTEVKLFPYLLHDNTISGFKKEIKESEFWVELNKE